jgi:SAM-dependent methyltransferase
MKSYKESLSTASTSSESEKLGDQKDIPYYAEGMKRHLKKKSSLFDYMPDDVTVFIDIGCATGDLLLKKWRADRQNESFHKKRTYIGVDISPAMIEQARVLTAGTGIIFTESIVEAIEIAAEKHATGEKTAMTLSSVLHEVIHYQPKNTHPDFWNNVWNKVIDYVAIRDFSVNDGLHNKPTEHDSVAQVREHFSKVDFPLGHPLAGQNVLTTWEYGYPAMCDSDNPLLTSEWRGWGSIDNSDSFVHFLMTIEYLRLDDPENYDRGLRELHENYMSLPFQSLCREIPTNFTPVYIERGITANRKNYLVNFFRRDILSEISPTKGIMIFKRRTDPNKALADSRVNLAIIDPVIRVLMERCINYVTKLIADNDYNPTNYLRTRPDQNLDKSMTL